MLLSMFGQPLLRTPPSSSLWRTHEIQRKYHAASPDYISTLLYFLHRALRTVFPLTAFKNKFQSPCLEPSKKIAGTNLGFGAFLNAVRERRFANRAFIRRTLAKLFPVVLGNFTSLAWAKLQINFVITTTMNYQGIISVKVQVVL